VLRRFVAGRDLPEELRLATKMTLTGTLAWWVSSALGAHRPIFAVLVPLVAMTGDPFSVVSVSVNRIVGIFAGVGIGIGIVHVGLPGTVTVAIALAFGTAAGILLRFGTRANVQAAVSALFMIGVAGSSHAGIARVWETAIGAALSVLVATFVWPPDPARELRKRLERLRQGLAADLAAVAEDLATGSGASAARLDDVRAHSLEAIRDVFELESAHRALRFSPLRHLDRPAVARIDVSINLGARLYRHTRSIARDVADATVRSETLAAATRHLADAADRSLSGGETSEPLARAADALAAPSDGDAAIVAAQLRQLLADLRVATAGGDFERAE